VPGTAHGGVILRVMALGGERGLENIIGPEPGAVVWPPGSEDSAGVAGQAPPAVVPVDVRRGPKRLTAQRSPD